MNNHEGRITANAKLFHGLADPSRLAIIEALRGGALTVSELVEAAGLRQSNVSNHLARLRESGLVACEQQGRFMRYRLADTRVAAVLILAEDLLQGGAARERRSSPANRRTHPAAAPLVFEED